MTLTKRFIMLTMDEQAVVLIIGFEIKNKHNNFARKIASEAFSFFFQATHFELQVAL